MREFLINFVLLFLLRWRSMRFGAVEDAMDVRRVVRTGGVELKPDVLCRVQFNLRSLYF